MFNIIGAFLIFIGCIAIFAFICEAMGISADDIDNTLCAIAALFGILFTFPVVFYFFRRDIRRNQEDNHQHHLKVVQSIENSNRIAQQNYDQRYEKYQMVCSIVDAARASFHQQLRFQEEQLQRAEEATFPLHAKNILYEGYKHDIVALYSIREYLKMGICETLEGANGAYAQYLNDVRTQRICSSIDELRQDVLSAISQLQTNLLSQLKVINNNIEYIGAGIKDSIDSLQEIQKLSARDFERHLRNANQSLEKIQHGTALIALNQYIANRMAGVDAYLA